MCAVIASNVPQGDTEFKAAITATNLCLGYGDLAVIDRLSFQIQAQEFVSLLGPTGCGKSTLLRAIAGLLSPSSGELQLHTEAGDSNIGRPRVGLMFQKPLLLPWRTTLQNVLLPVEIELRQKKVSVHHLARARHVLSLVQLSNFENAYPHQLSGGMQQRAALARALMADPELLLLDEPFGALDELTRETLNEQLLQIWGSADTRLKTIVMVTHSITEAVALSDRVMVFAARPARLIDDVPIPFSHPRTIESASFAASVSHIRKRIRQAP